MKPLKNLTVRQPDFPRETLTQDALSLFSGKKAGHMGAWQYQKPLYEGDPAGGAALWSEFVKNSKDYYLFQADVDIIDQSQAQLRELLQGVRTLAEIGPGSEKAVRFKTIPLLSLTPNDCQYIAIDCDEESAGGAAHFVQESFGRLASTLVTDAFQLRRFDADKPMALTILGSTITNIQGDIGQSYHLRLAQLVQNYRSAMSDRDVLMATFDTNIDLPGLDKAYNHPDHAAFGVSAIHLMARECNIQGNFDPHQWRYEPIISLASRQVAHCVYPVCSQHFGLNGQELKIQAGQHFVMNNSYKYDPGDINRVMQTAGFNVEIVRVPANPMAMVIGRL